MKLNKLLLTGCVLGAGIALIKWAVPRYEEVKMALSNPLPDGNYVILRTSGALDPIKIRDGIVYAKK